MISKQTEDRIFRIGGWFVNLLLLGVLLLCSGLIAMLYHPMMVISQCRDAESLVPLLQNAAHNVMDASTKNEVEQILLVEELKASEFAELGEYESWFPDEGDVVYWVRVNDNYTIGIGRDGTIHWDVEN